MTTGSEPRIISTMASKNNIQASNQGTLSGNSNAEEIYRELLDQHKARKLEDPVIIFRSHQSSIEFILLNSSFFSPVIFRNTLNWIRLI